MVAWWRGVVVLVVLCYDVVLCRGVVVLVVVIMGSIIWVRKEEREDMICSRSKGQERKHLQRLKNDLQ